MAAAEQTRASYDQRWQRILRRRGGDPGLAFCFYADVLLDCHVCPLMVHDAICLSIVIMFR